MLMSRARDRRKSPERAIVAALFRRCCPCCCLHCNFSIALDRGPRAMDSSTGTRRFVSSMYGQSKDEPSTCALVRYAARMPGLCAARSSTTILLAASLGRGNACNRSARLSRHIKAARTWPTSSSRYRPCRFGISAPFWLSKIVPPNRGRAPPSYDRAK